MTYLTLACDKCGEKDTNRHNTDKYIRSYRYKCHGGSWVPMDLCYTCYRNYLKWGFEVKIK